MLNGIVDQPAVQVRLVVMKVRVEQAFLRRVNTDHLHRCPTVEIAIPQPDCFGLAMAEGLVVDFHLIEVVDYLPLRGVTLFDGFQNLKSVFYGRAIRAGAIFLDSIGSADKAIQRPPRATGNCLLAATNFLCVWLMPLQLLSTLQLSMAGRNI